MSTEDFHNHVQKQSHKDKESSLTLQFQNELYTNRSAPITLLAKNGANNSRCFQQSNGGTHPNNIATHDEFGFTNQPNLSVSNNVDSNSSIQRSTNESMINLPHLHPEVTALRTNITPVIEISNDIRKATTGPITVHLKPEALQELSNLLNGETTSQDFLRTAINLTSRMIRRPFDKIEITALLTRYLKIFESNLKMIPFGSATYGFSGSITNFNILVNAGNCCLLN